MKSSYETLETRRLTDARKAAKTATTIATDVKSKVEDPETGLDAALNQANQAIEIIQDPDGPVQQALGEATTARDEAQAAQADADQALSDAALAKTTADGKNRIFRGSWSTTPPTPTGGFVQGDLWFKITSSGRVTGVYVWNGTAWVSNLIVADEILVPGSLGATSIKDGAITTPLIQSGAIVTDKLAAGSATIDKLTIGDTSNMVDDPTFANQAWSRTDSTITYYEASAGRAIRFSYASGARYAKSGIFKGIAPGDEFLVRALTYNRAVGATLNIRVEWLDANGTLVANGTNATTPGAANDNWKTKTVAVTAPAGASALRFVAAILASNIPTNNPPVLFREPQVLRRSNGELIVDGSVTAVKIAARTITAAKIAANAITANEIASRTITAAEIKTRTITASEIVANTITANEIKAGTITSNEIKAGTITAAELNANAINGMTITGAVIQTSSTGVRVRLAGNDIRFLDEGGNLRGQIISQVRNLGGMGLAAWSWRTDEAVRRVYFAIDFANGGSGSSRKVADISTKNINADSIGVGFLLGSNGLVGMNVTQLINSVQGSSLRKLKLSIETQQSPRLLDLTYRSWLDKSAVEQGPVEGVPDPTIRRVGAIAEEMHALAPELCTYDEYGNLIGIAYDRVGIALIPFLRDLTNRVEALEGKQVTVWPTAPEYNDNDLPEEA